MVYNSYIYVIISILDIHFAVKFHIFIICPNLWWYSTKSLKICHIKEYHIHTSNKGPWPQPPVPPVPPLFDALHCRAPSSHPVARFHPQWHENTIETVFKTPVAFFLTCDMCMKQIGPTEMCIYIYTYHVLITNLHPGRLTWNLQITHLERKWSSKPLWLCSMLIFTGVTFSQQNCYSKIIPHLALPRDSKHVRSVHLSGFMGSAIGPPGHRKCSLQLSKQRTKLWCLIRSWILSKTVENTRILLKSFHLISIDSSFWYPSMWIIKAKWMSGIGEILSPTNRKALREN